MSNSKANKVDKLIDQLIELDDNIDLTEIVLDDCLSSTRHLHIRDLKKYERTYNRKLQLLKILKG